MTAAKQGTPAQTPSDTPRTNAVLVPDEETEYVASELLALCRTLERELYDEQRNLRHHKNMLDQAERELAAVTVAGQQAMKLVDMLRSELAARREGYVEVPREPTKEMLDAAAALPAFKQIDSWCAEMQLARGRKACWEGQESPLAQAYKAMLSAAAAPEEK